MKKLLVSLVVLLLAAARPVAAQEVVVKLGTSAPLGSPWHEALKDIANKWRDLSGGRVALRLFVAGTMGDESDLLQKVRIGQLQAVAMSTGGLHAVTPQPLVLDLPGLAASDAEHTVLVEKMAPAVEKALDDKGFVVLGWSEIGSASFFSAKSRPTLPEMRAGKLFVWSGDPTVSDAFKAGGFNGVSLASTDIVPSLQTGRIDTVLLPPALLFGLDPTFAKVKFMTSPSFATVTGAVVVDKKTWDKVPADLHESLQKVVRERCAAATALARKANADALAAFKKAGGQVVSLKDAVAWSAMVTDVTAKSLRGKVVPAATYDEAQAVLKDYRATHK